MTQPDSKTLIQSVADELKCEIELAQQIVHDLMRNVTDSPSRIMRHIRIWKETISDMNKSVRKRIR